MKKRGGVGLELFSGFGENQDIKPNAALRVGCTVADHSKTMANGEMHTPPDTCELELRQDGAVLVRVRSQPVNGRTLPDAVFAFRVGDPQYSYWEQQLRERQLVRS